MLDDQALSQPPNCALTRSPTAWVARPPVMKNLAELDFTGSPITQGLMRDLREGGFLATQRNCGADRRNRHREKSCRVRDRRELRPNGTRLRSAVASCRDIGQHASAAPRPQEPLAAALGLRVGAPLSPHHRSRPTAGNRSPQRPGTQTRSFPGQRDSQGQCPIAALRQTNSSTMPLRDDGSKTIMVSCRSHIPIVATLSSGGPRSGRCQV
jgi:hypothetical protein